MAVIKVASGCQIICRFIMSNCILMIEALQQLFGQAFISFHNLWTKVPNKSTTAGKYASHFQ